MKEIKLKHNSGEHTALVQEAPEDARGVVIFVHGLGEHIGRYSGLYALFQSFGYHSIGTDHYGHGKSAGKRGDIPGFNHFREEVDSMFAYSRDRFGKLPIVLYGHSLGGNIALNYLLTGRYQPDHAIVTSPWLRLDQPVNKITELFSQLMLRLSPSFTISSGLDPEGISTDSSEVQKYIADPLVHDKISVRLFHEASASADMILSSAEKLITPTLLLHGTADPITSHLGSKELAEKNPQYITFKLFPGMRHELHHEKERESVFNSIRNWMNPDQS